MSDQPDRAIELEEATTTAVARRGRKTLLTTDLISQFVRYMRAGNPETVVADYLGISRTTMNGWKQKQGAIYELFRAELSKARAESQVRALGVILSTAMGRQARPAEYDASGRLVRPAQTERPPDLRALQWFLERSNPEQWARRELLTVETGDVGPAVPQEVLTADMAQLSDEELNQYEAILRKTIEGAKGKLEASSARVRGRLAERAAGES